MPKLLLINPAIDHTVLGNIRATTWPPLNLPYIAAVTPPHYDIQVIDENIEPFVHQDADVVGITAMTSSVFRAYQIAQHYRSRGIPTIMGGIHVSMMPEEALKFCTAVVVGEAETAWPRLLQDLEAGKMQRRYEGEWQDLSALPLPRRDILKNSFYSWGSIQTSRGCPMDCTFCSVTAFNGRRFRRRNLDAVIQELQEIPQKKILIADDNIIGHGPKDIAWAKAFFRKVIDLKLNRYFFVQSSLQLGEDPELLKLAAQAGIKVALIGMESVDPQSLRDYKKNINLKHLEHHRYTELVRNIRRAGIAILAAFVLGGDNSNPAIFKATSQFIQSTGIDIIQTTKPTPLPGTHLWNALMKDGRIIDTDFPRAWKDYRLSRLVFEPHNMSRQDVYREFTTLRKIFYSPRQTIKRTLNTLWTTRDLIATIMAYRINASYRKAFLKSEHFQRFGKEPANRKPPKG
jgi:radical SAM superfamily enzyme YgiQ (UPF0313 family)